MNFEKIYFAILWRNESEQKNNIYRGLHLDERTNDDVTNHATYNMVSIWKNVRTNE